MTVSTTTRHALQRVDDNQGVLVLAELDHPSFAEPVYLVADTRNIVSQGIEYTALPFRFQMPQDKAKEMPRAEFEIDNVGREMTAELEALPPGAALTITVKVVHRATPDIVDFEFKAPLTGVRATMSKISGVLGPDEAMRQSCVRIRFDQRTAPGLVEG